MYIPRKVYYIRDVHKSFTVCILQVGHAVYLLSCKDSWESGELLKKSGSEAAINAYWAFKAKAEELIKVGKCFLTFCDEYIKYNIVMTYKLYTEGVWVGVWVKLLNP